MALTTVNSGLLGTYAQYTGFKNRLINSAMMIDQRNAGASASLTSSQTYFVDRWFGVEDTDGTMTIQRSTTAPTGFINSLLMTTTSADASLGATQICYVGQKIEGLNVYDLAWGTASASAVTLSFWVRSSLTGTFGGSLANAAFVRSYPFTYTISVANTFEYKTITIAGDTTGTWPTDNGNSFQLIFGLGVGSTYSGTAGAWAGTGYLSATSATSVIGTNGATFYITGVQLEKGSTATSFDYRPYGTELQLCQRYYQKSYNTDVAPTTSTPVGCLGAPAYGAGSLGLSFQFCTTMRATPTITVYSQTGSSGVVSQPGGTNVGSGFSVDQPSMRGSLAILSGSGMTTNSFYYCHYVANAEL